MSDRARYGHGFALPVEGQGTTVTAAAVIAGTLLALLVMVDIVLTVLHPGARGPLSHRVDSAAWSGVRTLARLSDRPRLLAHAGPAAVLATVLTWIFGLLVAFALIYVPYIDGFARDEGIDFEGPAFVRSLYVSSVALTTVGFGDVVATTNPLRLATTAEAGAGLAAITAAITYVLSLYPLVAAHRSTALRVNDLRLHHRDGAAAAAVAGDHSEIEALEADLTELHQDLRRFPVLYYFDAHDDAENPLRLLHGALVLLLTLRWGLETETTSPRRLQGLALTTTLVRLMDDFEEEYLGEAGDPDEAADAGRRALVAVRAAVAGLCPSSARAEHEDPPAELVELAARAHTFMAQFADAHLRDRPAFP